MMRITIDQLRWNFPNARLTQTLVDSFGTAGADTTLVALTGNHSNQEGGGELGLILTPEGCIFTRTKPGVFSYVAIVIASVVTSPGDATGACDLGIALNGDLIGDAPTTNAAAQAGVFRGHIAANGANEQLIAHRFVTMVQNDTIQPVAAFTSDAHDLLIQNLRFFALPCNVTE